MKIKVHLALLFVFHLFTNNLFAEANTNNSQFEILDPNLVYSLGGDWKISHIVDDKFKLNDYPDLQWEKIRVPSTWMYFGKENTFGWYRVSILIGEQLKGNNLGFIPPNLLEASEIYFNGIRIGKLGEIDTDGNLIQNNPRYDYFEIDKSLVRYGKYNLISIKVANYYGGVGGTQNMPYLGRLELIQQKFNIQIIVYSSFVFGLLGLGIYHIIIFLKMRNDKVYLYYACMVFSMSAFILFTHRLNYWFLESFALHYLLVVFAISCSGIFVYLFTCSYFNYTYARLNKIILPFYLGLVVLEILPLIFPSLFYFRNMYLVRIHIMVNLAFIIGSIYLLFKAFKEHKVGWNILLLGAVISFPLFTWDSFKLLGVVQQNNWHIIEICFLITVTFAVAISKKYSNEYEHLLQIEKNYAKDLTLEVREKTNNLQKINEELNKANQLKNKLFHIISQTLKNPLDTLEEILLVASKKQYKQVNLKTYFERIHENLKQNHILLENLLNWSSLKLSEKESIKLSKFDIIPLLNETVFFLIQEAENKNIEVICDFPKSIFVFSHQNMVRLIFLNLISNSIKFTPRDGTVIIKITSENSFISVEFVDSGVGITKVLLEKILIQNELVTTLGTASEKGAGLGLRVTKDFINKLGGEIFFESEVNLGTKVKIKLQTDKNE